MYAIIVSTTAAHPSSCSPPPPALPSFGCKKIEKKYIDDSTTTLAVLDEHGNAGTGAAATVTAAVVDGDDDDDDDDADVTLSIDETLAELEMLADQVKVKALDASMVKGKGKSLGAVEDDEDDEDDEREKGSDRIRTRTRGYSFFYDMDADSEQTLDDDDEDDDEDDDISEILALFDEYDREAEEAARRQAEGRGGGGAVCNRDLSSVSAWSFHCDRRRQPARRTAAVVVSSIQTTCRQVGGRLKKVLKAIRCVTRSVARHRGRGLARVPGQSRCSDIEIW
ncbi:hypothetical protein AMATHDRAFT_8823 [Amanita thiersii Skay4041]|uniref:Uncharacterized protein n=1 Tax=Amanita thiersii Skay4041 TaxID=703135 RepID=A0A2A9ND11_9AGAR|nr:hypothetical protein AMATHDRAFT_8823 [Amanita thiersii Skay4041]